jgi:amino acid adenylation domain-containing protein
MKLSVFGQAIPAALPFPEMTDHDSVPRRFRQLADLLPDHPAVGDEADVLTYGELDRMSDSIARFLQDRLGVVAEPVLLYMPNTCVASAGMLGILKAGKFYVAVDPAMDTGAFKHIWRDSRARMVLTMTVLEGKARELVGDNAAIASLDNVPVSAGEIVIDVGCRSLAAIYYTSGSTGQPKGVLADHAMLLYRGWQFCQEEGMRPSDRVLNLFSNAFALSATLFWGALLNGATVYLRTPGEGQPRRIFDWLWEYAITVAYLTPALARSLADAPLRRSAPESVRWIALGGQSVSSKEAALVRAQFPTSAVFINRLGSSEAALIARHVIQVADLQDDAGPVPVGKGAANLELTIMNEECMALPPGIAGQIAVRSRYVSPGYWRDPELTAARFLPDPEGGDRRIFLTGDLGRMTPDGLLEYLGRQDLMVKIRGYRVEPEAIERAMLAHPAIRDCVVAARTMRSGEPRLIAYLLANDGSRASAGELRAFLAMSLPDYMIPARYVHLERMPLTASGKVDRKALPPPGTSRPDLGTPFVAPRTESERQIADIWAELLELDEVGVDDDFFDLGGDSITALRAALAIEKRCGRSLPANYFHNPTIAMLDRTWAGAAPIPAAPRLRSPASADNPRPGRVDRLLHGHIVADAPAALRLAARQVTLHLSYHQGCRWLALWCRQPVVQDRLFRRESELLNRLCMALGIPAPSRRQRQVFLFGNILWALLRQSCAVESLSSETILSRMASGRHRFWRDMASLSERKDVPGRCALIAFDGLEHMRQARQKGRGVVLVTYHSPAMMLATALLNRHAEGEPILVLSQIKAGRLALRAQAESWSAGAQGEDAKVVSRARKSAWPAALGIEGLRVLRAGGIVQVANEAGYDTAGTLPRAIGGRIYRLNPGFAELDLATGAIVLPMYSSYDLSGAIRVTLLPPFEIASGPAAASERTADMVDQYARFAETAWRSAPTSLTWQVIGRYFIQPAAASGGER